MLRKLFFGACIGGLLMGQFYEAPKVQQERSEKLILDLQSSDQKTRQVAEFQLLKIAKYKTVSQPQEAEILITKILASNPNSEAAHMRLAEIQLKRWSVKKNPSDKVTGMKHLRRAIELYKQADAEIIAQKLEKVESQVNQGTPSYNWIFPKF